MRPVGKNGRDGMLVSLQRWSTASVLNLDKLSHHLYFSMNFKNLHLSFFLEKRQEREEAIRYDPI